MNTQCNDRLKLQLGVCLGVLCLGSFGAFAANSNPDRVTYTRDVAPILNANCGECHRPGEVAPMSLLSYKEVRPWAKSIKEKVSKREMPPWFADPAHGVFSNDARLSEEEIEIILRWVDQGAVRGNPKDMPDLPHYPEGWRMGDPDHIISLPEVHIPADGADYFPNLSFTADVPQDRWIRALEIRPSNREVAHHVVIFMSSFGSGGMGSNFDVLGVWSVGTEPNVFPEGTGRRIKKGQRFLTNMHYHPNGVATTDQTRIGLYFGEGELEHEITAVLAGSYTFVIPPEAPNHEIVSSWSIDNDIKIVSLFPHMHLRGKDMKFTAVYPDGREEILLSVPKYDFDWQLFYYPEELLSLPMGSRIDLVAHYDNSSNNPNNPDPMREVRFGTNTTDEMMFGLVEFFYDGDASPAKVTEADRLRSMVASLPPDDVYAVDFRFGSQAIPSALYLPATGDGEWLISYQGMQINLPVSDISWDGEQFQFKMTFRFGEMGGDFKVRGIVNDRGEITGSLRTEDESVSFIMSDFEGTRMAASDSQ